MSIKIENITYIYKEGLPDEAIALENVSLDIEDGEFVGIIGHTGSGKSTFVQHLNGLLKPKSGKIIIGDKDITEPKVSMLDIRKQIGLVFQYPEYQLFDETVALDVGFGPKNLGLDEEESEKRVREAIKAVGLDYDEIKEKSPFDFSGGQKRRIAIAGVIAMKPQVLVLDEPTAGLDPIAHQEILDMICDIHKRDNNITILVSHNMDDIAKLADKVVVMEAGHIAMMGTPKEVFGRGDELLQMGLDVPSTTDIAIELNNNGLDVATDIFTAEELADSIEAALKKGGPASD